MKRLLIAFVARSFLATPMAFAQSAGASFELAQAHERYRHRPVDRHVDRTYEKRVIIKKYRWARGHRMSAAERRHMAYVNDYRRYRLRPPSRGQQWVRVDNDFLLISLATGVIVGLASAH